MKRISCALATALVLTTAAVTPSHAQGRWGGGWGWRGGGWGWGPAAAIGTGAAIGGLALGAALAAPAYAFEPAYGGYWGSGPYVDSSWSVSPGWGYSGWGTDAGWGYASADWGPTYTTSTSYYDEGPSYYGGVRTVAYGSGYTTGARRSYRVSSRFTHRAGFRSAVYHSSRTNFGSTADTVRSRRSNADMTAQRQGAPVMARGAGRGERMNSGTTGMGGGSMNRTSTRMPAGNQTGGAAAPQGSGGPGAMR